MKEDFTKGASAAWPCIPRYGSVPINASRLPGSGAFVSGTSLQSRRGFTLVEILIALFLGLLVLTGLYSFLILENRTFRDQEQAVEMQQNVRAAMALMVQELRMAGFDPLGSNRMGIKEAKRQSITFCLDKGSDKDNKDNDGQNGKDDPGERGIPNGEFVDSNEYVTYAVYEREKTKVLGRSSATGMSLQPVAENIPTLRFDYFGSDPDTSLSVPVANGNLGGIRKIQITLTGEKAKPDPWSRLPVTYTLVSTVVPWNLQ